MGGTENVDVIHFLSTHGSASLTIRSRPSFLSWLEALSEVEGLRTADRVRTFWLGAKQLIPVPVYLSLNLPRPFSSTYYGGSTFKVQ